VEEFAVFERVLNRLLEILERVLVPLAERHVLGVEAAFQQEIGQRFEQVLGIDTQVLTGVAGIMNPFHGGGLCQLYWRRAFGRSGLPSSRGSRRFSSAPNPLSSLRLMRRCACSPSSTNSAAAARTASGSLGPRPSALVFSTRPCMPLNCSTMVA